MRLLILCALLGGTWLGPVCCSVSLAGDYFLTLGGGYAPQGNQASLEANVLFFQQVLVERQLSESPHRIYFADGFDAKHDLQVLRKKQVDSSPVLQQLASIFRLDRDELVYRNHQVSKISGGIRAAEIQDGLDSLSRLLRSGDRLFVYVTAHGGSARKGELQDTSITCWGNKPLAMSDFSGWLDELPAGVTVVSVMAQCYCGGFANTLFKAGDPEQGFAANTRCGFFAQQHDLPAAGCRPDVENDEEYSSYFWGAFLGRSRTGKATGTVDCNGDGRISLAEAHAYAMVASNTIDIPLCTSDVLLRRYSRIAGYDIASSDAASSDAVGSEAEGEKENEVEGSETQETVIASPPLAFLTGTLYELAAQGRPNETRIVVGLAELLEIPVSTTIAEFTQMYEQQQKVMRDARRAGFRRSRGSSSRRQLMASIVEKWPELEDSKQWGDSTLLAVDNQSGFAEELQQLPGFAEFVKGQADREAAQVRATNAELRNVKFRRMLQQLESIVLAQNLAFVASPEVVEKFRTILKAEEGFLGKP